MRRYRLCYCVVGRLHNMWFVLLCAILLAGADAATQMTRNEGDDFTFTKVAPLTDDVGIESCHLTQPNDETLDFFPNQPSPHSDRFSLVPIIDLIPACSITVTKLTVEDSGYWEVGYKATNGSADSQSFYLNVFRKEIDEDYEYFTDNDTFWLSPIEYPTRVGQDIDISLYKIDHEEECFVRKPGNEAKRATKINDKRVIVRPTSNFVSCRITISPIDEDLLGEWHLCGIYQNEDKQTKRRCTVVRISWNDVNSPDYVWNTHKSSHFSHVVHEGGTLSPTVVGVGETVTCHIITPDGEDLILDHLAKYPGLNREVTNDKESPQCKITIGPITTEMLGDWVIYGKFSSALSGLNEVRFPFDMVWFDQSNPSNKAYNITVMDPVIRTVNLERIISVDLVSTGHVDNCQFTAPNGQDYDLDTQDNFIGASFVNTDSEIACRLSIGPITKELIGNWRLLGKFSNNGRFTALQRTVLVHLEDPANPIEEERLVENLTERHFQTSIGKSHTIRIYFDSFIHGESCHIQDPGGFQYKFMEGMSPLSDVEFLREPGVECSVKIDVRRQTIGSWVLIARAERFSRQIERRQPFTINVEEFVEALPNEVQIEEGDDLLVRLSEATEEYDSCSIIKPNSHSELFIVKNPLEVAYCGYIIRNLKVNDSGIWEISYGSKITYRALINVTVAEVDEVVDTQSSTLPPSSGTNLYELNLQRDSIIDKEVGPENVDYCRITDPFGSTIFEDFGRCRLTLNRVACHHQGLWKMNLGFSDRVITEEHGLIINVIDAGLHQTTTFVEKNRPNVTVTCSINSEHHRAIGCVFRNPSGKILIANGASEGRYSFIGSTNSNSNEFECGFQITDPQVSDLGIWRCEIYTDGPTYYGFPKVLCPWALQDPVVAATVRQEPQLEVDDTLVNGVEGEPLTISCSVDAAIRYCYFRRDNGSVFTVLPGMQSEDMEYVGAGFAAGECGVRFRNLRQSDNGQWACHAGLFQQPLEQRSSFRLVMREMMFLDQFRANNGIVVLAELNIDSPRALEYCRFVRIDGLGFTNDNLPVGYSFEGNLEVGVCRLLIRDVTTLARHPWTVVAKIRGSGMEITGTTLNARLLQPDNGMTPSRGRNGFQVFMIIILVLAALSILLGVFLGPRKNRHWVSHRASVIKQRMHRRQNPPPPYTPTT